VFKKYLEYRHDLTSWWTQLGMYIGVLSPPPPPPPSQFWSSFLLHFTSFWRIPPIFYETRKFITVFNRAGHLPLSWASWMLSTFSFYRRRRRRRHHHHHCYVHGRRGHAHRPVVQTWTQCYVSKSFKATPESVRSVTIYTLEVIPLKVKVKLCHEDVLGE
jgi:hypothetical protein